ncbi:MAG TPA: DMT family transporter [Tahibacter sp.]|nr:DMT family transporter [Tahibacter sp.]
MSSPSPGRDAVAPPPASSSLPLADYRRGLALAATGAVLFSAKAIVAKLMYRYPVDAVTVLTLRMVFAAPFFAAIAAWQCAKAPSLAWRDRFTVVGLGLVGYYLSSFLDFLGLQYISAGLERLILFLTPSFVLLLSTVALKRRIDSRQWLAMAVAYAGIVLVFAHDLSFAGERVALGTAFVFGSALSYALYLTGTGELVGRVGPTRLVAYAMCVSTVACVVQYALLRPWSALTELAPAVYGLSAINAVFCTVAPVVLTMWAVARIGAPSASQAGMIGPVSTLLLGAWLLGEPITLWQTAGSALVLGGMYLLSTKRSS